MIPNIKIRLKELSIENFRGIEKAQLSFDEINFLIGDNGSGKTTIHAAIARLFPILRGEKRIFLDGDLYFSNASIAQETKLKFVIEISDTKANRSSKISLEIKGRRITAGLNRSHLNDQTPAEKELIILDEKGNDAFSFLKEIKDDISSFRYKVIRNGWIGGRISAISLSNNTGHAATNMSEEMGFYDAFRARLVEVFKNSNLAANVSKNHPNLKQNVLDFANRFLGEQRFIDVIPASQNQISLRRIDGAIIPWEGLSGGETSTINLAMAIEFEKIEHSQFVLFEEPESNLHPSIQEDFIEKMRMIFPNSQIFISTHSPYIFRNSIYGNKLLITKKENGKIVIQDFNCKSIFGTLGPSWGEISYHAYGIGSFEFHNELYGVLIETNMCYSEKEIENFFAANSCIADKDWIRENKGVAQPTYKVTLMTYIRNYIHHPENKHNPPFTKEELLESIKKMLLLI